MLTPYYEGPAKDRGSMQDQADMVTNSSDVEVCLEEPPGSMCAKPDCPPVSTTFLLFLLHFSKFLFNLHSTI